MISGLVVGRVEHLGLGCVSVKEAGVVCVLFWVRYFGFESLMP